MYGALGATTCLVAVFLIWIIASHKVGFDNPLTHLISLPWALTPGKLSF
jgi:hypothetical protein